MSTHPLEVDDDDVNSVLASGIFVQSSLDFSRFKNEKGEFKRWLNLFYLEQDRKGRQPYFRVTHVLPWLWDGDKVDLEFHAAAFALGAYDKYPLVWRSMRWTTIKPHSRSPYYGMFAANVSRSALNHQIKVSTGYDTALGVPFINTDFWKALEHHVLLPTIRGSLAPHVWTNTTE